MARTVGDIPVGREMPPVGEHRCTCIATKRDVSKVKKTAYLELEWMSPDGDGNSFADMLFLTPKAINRVAMVAQRVCGMPKNEPIPDDDKEAIEFLASFIEENVVNREAIVTIEEVVETFIYEDGPKIGQTGERKKRRVSFGGYKSVSEPTSGDGNNLPF